MRGVTTVAAGTTFTGLGTLVNDSTGDMTLHDGLDTAFVDLDNEGILRLGSSPGQVEVNGFDQAASGEWVLEVGGSLPNEFDSLMVDSTAELAGLLTLSLIDGHVPTLGTSYNILIAPFGVTGTFDSVLGGVEGDVRLGVVYQATQVLLFATYSADFDVDGDVDEDDLSQWEGDFAQNGNSDADGDGDSDAFDLLVWQQQFGSSISLPTAHAFVPEPSSWMLMLVAAMACPRRRLVSRR